MQFLTGCSRSSAEAAQPQLEKIDLAGVGPVLKSFDSTYSLFDVDVLNTQNRHNEKNVSSYCSSNGFLAWMDEPFTRDDTRITGSQISDHEYKLTINVNSEVGTVMWAGDVTTSFVYDTATKSWSMSSSMFENGADRPYLYCAPSAVVDTLLSSLQCYVSGNADTPEAEALQSLLKSLTEQRDRMIQNSGKLYVGTGCEEAVDPNKYGNDTPAPMGF